MQAVQSLHAAGIPALAVLGCQAAASLLAARPPTPANSLPNSAFGGREPPRLSFSSDLPAVGRTAARPASHANRVSPALQHHSATVDSVRHLRDRSQRLLLTREPPKQGFHTRGQAAPRLCTRLARAL